MPLPEICFNNEKLRHKSQTFHFVPRNEMSNKLDGSQFGRLVVILEVQLWSPRNKDVQERRSYELMLRVKTLRGFFRIFKKVKRVIFLNHLTVLIDFEMNVP